MPHPASSLIAATLVLAAATPAVSGTVRVPGDAASPAEAVALLSAGDTLRIDAGVFEGDVVIGDLDGVTLRARRGVEIRGRIRATGCADLTIDGVVAVGISAFDCRTLTITGCDLVGADVAGIALEECRSARVEDTDVEGAAEAGIEGIAVSGTTLVRCEIRGVGKSGLLLEGAGIVVDRCDVEGAGDVGIVVDGSDCLVRRSTVVNAPDGIRTLGPRSPIERCAVEDIATDSEGVGIRTDGDASPVVRCKVERGDDGIATTGADSPVSGSTTRECGGIGVVTFGDRSPVTKCRDRFAGGVAVETFGLQSSIVRCVAVGSRNGLVVFGSGSHIERCKATNVAQVALRVEAADVRIDRCRVRGGGSAESIVSVALQLSGARSSARRSRVTNWAGHGAAARRQDTTMESVRISRAGRTGIILYWGGSLVRDCVVLRSGESGILVDAGSCRVERTTVKKSGGLDLREGDSVTGNTYEKNRVGTTNVAD